MNATVSPPDARGGASVDIASAVGAILSDPNAMSLISSLISGKGGAAESESKNHLPPRHDEALPVAAPARSAIPSKEGKRDPRRELLCALKPYVSPHRRDMIDRLIGILGVLELAAPLLGGGLGNNSHI